jgi:hypothetical protein
LPGVDPDDLGAERVERRLPAGAEAPQYLLVVHPVDPCIFDEAFAVA